MPRKRRTSQNSRHPRARSRAPPAAPAQAQREVGRRVGAPYERFVRPLSRDDQERYYQEMALVARLFGTPASVIPRALAEFREYFAAQISIDETRGALSRQAWFEPQAERRIGLPRHSPACVRAASLDAPARRSQRLTLR